jgi:hypothetical protein
VVAKAGLAFGAEIGPVFAELKSIGNCEGDIVYLCSYGGLLRGSACRQR